MAGACIVTFESYTIKTTNFHSIMVTIQRVQVSNVLTHYDIPLNGRIKPSFEKIGTKKHAI